MNPELLFCALKLGGKAEPAAFGSTYKAHTEADHGDVVVPPSKVPLAFVIIERWKRMNGLCGFPCFMPLSCISSADIPNFKR